MVEKVLVPPNQRVFYPNPFGSLQSKLSMFVSGPVPSCPPRRSANAWTLFTPNPLSLRYEMCSSRSWVGTIRVPTVSISPGPWMLGLLLLTEEVGKGDDCCR